METFCVRWKEASVLYAEKTSGKCILSPLRTSPLHQVIHYVYDEENASNSLCTGSYNSNVGFSWHERREGQQLQCSSEDLEMDKKTVLAPSRPHSRQRLYNSLLMWGYTHSLMELSPSWEAANCAATQEITSILWNPKVYCRPYPEPDRSSPSYHPILSHVGVHPAINCFVNDW
jgi:hypothetical protein